MAKCTMKKCVNIREKTVYFLVFFFIIVIIMNIADIWKSKLIFLLSAVGEVSHNLFYFKKRTYKSPPRLQGRGEIHNSKDRCQ